MSHDLTTTAGKIADFRDRMAQAAQPSGPEAVEKQHARGKNTARERIELLLDPDSFVEFDALATAPLHRLRDGKEEAPRRRRGLRLRHRGRASGGRLQPGLQRLRRLAEPGQRREDRQGPGIRAAQRLPRGGDPRRRRRAHPGGRGLTGHVRGHLPQQRPCLRRGPADLADHGPVRRRCGLLPRPDGLRGHGGQDQSHVHHRPRRDQDRHRRGRGHGDPGRGAPAQQHHRNRDLPGHGREGRHRVRPRTARLPALQQPRRGSGHRTRPGPGRSTTTTSPWTR